ARRRRAGSGTGSGAGLRGSASPRRRPAGRGAAAPRALRSRGSPRECRPRRPPTAPAGSGAGGSEPMSVVGQKYGGTSVAVPEEIKRVARRVAATAAGGSGVCVVVSAMGDTTDRLIDLAREISPDPHPREQDMLLTAGERISMALLSMALIDLGCDAVSFTGSQAGIVPGTSHGRGRIVEMRRGRVHDAIDEGKVAIVAGFQGVSTTKDVTTLGRGGSDTTAVALAAALGAESCEIYTDVEGVYSADPRIVPGARK